MEFIPQGKLDYHDRGSLHPYDIEKLLNEFLEDSYIAGYTEVIVVTGKGAVVRPLVDRLLKKHKLVRKYESAGYYNGQTGAFEVHLQD